MNVIPKYIKTEAQRDAFVVILMFLPFSLLVMAYEISLIPNELVNLYLSLKLFTIIWTGLNLYLVTKHPYNQSYIFLATISATAYAAAGEYFSPLYHYSYVMTFLAIAILLRPKMRTLLPMLVLGPIPILYFQHLKEVGQLTHARTAITLDYIMISLEFALIIFVVFEGFSKRRRKEIEFRERFAVIGEDLNTFAHNIKSMLSSQFIINENLREGVQENACVKNLLTLQDENLNRIHEYLNDFNILGKTEFESVFIAESVRKTLRILNFPAQSVLHELDENFQVTLVKQDFETILINIFSNAKKAIDSNATQMKLELVNEKLTITYPFNKEYKSTSGIGESISRKLARKNDLIFDTEFDDDLYSTILTF